MRIPVRTMAIVAAFVFVAAFPVAMVVSGERDDWRDRMRGHMNGGVDTSSEALTAGGARNSIDIRDFAFRPGNLRIPVGGTVTWTNFDEAPHTATDKDGAWDTGRLDEGESITLTFEQPGDFQYYCVYHPDMEARLIIE